MATQQELDAVTAKEMRECYEETLDGQIEVLAGLIKRGHHERFKAEEYLRDTIGLTLTHLDNIRSFAGLPVLKKKIRGSE